jgi:hydrogenase maturation factor
MACLLSESDAEREVAHAGVAGVLVIGVLLVARAVGLVVWLLVHAAAAISEVSPNAAAAANALVDLFGLTAEAPSSGVAGDLFGSASGVATVDR